MKKFILEFLRNGLFACGGGPIVWAIVYLILSGTGVATEVSAGKVAIEVLTITILAFVAGGIGAVYRVERFPLAIAILLHGTVLYAAYLAIYLLNGWLAREVTPLLVFTAIFFGGYAIVWLVIYLVNRHSAARMTAKLSKLSEE